MQADEAAEQYHDQSVNENDHLAHALRIMKETGVFACLNAGARRVVRSTVISMVLKVSNQAVILWAILAKIMNDLGFTTTDACIIPDGFNNQAVPVLMRFSTDLLEQLWQKCQ